MLDGAILRARFGARSAGAAALLLCAPAVLAAQSPGIAGDETPEWEWPAQVEGPLRTFFEREDVEALLDDVVEPELPTTSRVDELAGILGAGLEQPFRFVQRRIRFEPYSGSIRGAAGALRSGGGNALDQALLLRALYEAVGHSARLVRGRLEWDRAVQLAGDGTSGSLSRGDPWLRRVEAASDHWWIEVRERGDWVAADPTFPQLSLGESAARRREVVTEVPDRLRATVEFNLVAGGRSLGGMRLDVAEVFGSGVHVALAWPEPDPEPDTVEGALSESAGSEGSVPQTEASLPEAESGAAGIAPDHDRATLPDPLDPAPVEAALPPDPGTIVVLQLEAAGRSIRALPIAREDLGQVRLAVDIEVPPGRHVRAALPFGADPTARLVAIVAGGALQREMYAPQLRTLHGVLTDLVDAELEALAAWRARPRPGDEAAAPAAEDPMPASAPPEAALERAPDEPMEPILHPAIRLHVAALQAWSAFERTGLEALALALLASADELRTDTAVQRAQVRFVGLHYQPGSAGAAGAATAWIADPAQVDSGSSASAAPRQIALGLLQSAMAGQVLNRVADQAPITAFDLTLRAVGSGSRLSWYGGRSRPDGWPQDAMPAVNADLDTGRMVIGPRTPIRIDDVDLLAWWSIATATGMTSGRVERPLGIAQAGVTFGAPVQRATLDSVLASLHDLHEATRWLLTLGDPDRSVLRELVPGACAATPLVAELLRAGAPEGFVAPAFADFCQVAGAS